MSTIIDIISREILDSRGNPTLEVEVILEDGNGQRKHNDTNEGSPPHDDFAEGRFRIGVTIPSCRHRTHDRPTSRDD